MFLAALFFLHHQENFQILKEKCTFMSENGFINVCSKFKKMPEEFRPLIHYVSSLEFSSTPDYNYIKKILLEAMEKRNISVSL